MLSRLCLALVAAAAVAVGGSSAATGSGAACAKPRPIPAGMTKPARGASADKLANFLLALPQRRPCDVNLFTSTFQPTPPQFPKPVSGAYPEGRPMPLAAGAPASEAELRSQLAAFLAGVPGRARALRLFDSPTVEAKLADPTLRAALLSLYGTVAEPLVGFYLSRDYAATQFAVTVKRTQIAGGSGTAILFSRRYQGEHFALLAGIFAHEILRHDSGASATEEVLLHAIKTTVHMQLLSRHPELATSGTELARYMNQEVLIFVNSRQPGSSRSVIIAPDGRGTAPGSSYSKRDLYTHGKDFSLLGNSPGPGDVGPAPRVFRPLLRTLLAPGVKIPSAPTYSKKTAQLFSRMNDTWLSPVDRLRVSVLLGLVSMDEVVMYTGLSRTQAIARFHLAPILAAMS